MSRYWVQRYTEGSLYWVDWVGCETVEAATRMRAVYKEAWPNHAWRVIERIDQVID